MNAVFLSLTILFSIKNAIVVGFVIMGPISENINDVLESLGISVRLKASVLHEVVDLLYLSSCVSCLNDLETKTKAFAGHEEGILDEAELVDDAVQVVQAVQKEQGGKSVWRSSGSFFPKLKAIPSFQWLLNVFMVGLFAMFIDVRADLIELPENLPIHTNEMAIMKCKTNSTTKPIIWAGTDHASNDVSIFDGDKVNPVYKEFCSVTRDAGRFDLHVNATSQMALMYKCIEPGVENIERTAELIVIETRPTCVVSPNIPDNASNTEFIDLVCNMSLSGNWIPSLTWRVNGIQEPLTALNHTQRLGGQRVIVTSTLRNVSRNDKHKYVCEAYFSMESHTGVTARNVPAYKYTCTPGDFQPTLSTTLPPVPEPTTRNICPYVWSTEFVVFLTLFVIESVALIVGFIVCLSMNNWKLPFLESKKKRADCANGGTPRADTSDENESVALQIDEGRLTT